MRPRLIFAAVAIIVPTVFAIWVGVLNSGIFNHPRDRIPSSMVASVDGLEQALADQIKPLNIDISVFGDDKNYLQNLKQAIAQTSAGNPFVRLELNRLADALLKEADSLEAAARLQVEMIGLWRGYLKQMRLGLRGHELDVKFQSILEGTTLTSVSIKLSKINLEGVVQSIHLNISRFEEVPYRRALADLGSIHDNLVTAANGVEVIRSNIEGSTKILMNLNGKLP